MSDAGTFAFIDGKLVQLSPSSLMAKTDVPLAAPVSTNPAIVSYTMTPTIPLGAVLSIPWMSGSPAIGVNLHGQPQVPNMVGLVQSNVSSPMQSKLTSNVQKAPVFHQNVVQPGIHSVLSTVPIIQPSIQEGIQQNVAVAPQGVSMVVQNFPPILTQMPGMINQGTINIVNQSPSNYTQAVPTTQHQSMSVEAVMTTQSSVRQTPSPSGLIISSVQSLSKPHISGKQFIYSPDNDCIGVMESLDPKQVGPLGAKKPGNRWRTPTPPNMLSTTKTPPPNMLCKTRNPVQIEPKFTNKDKRSNYLDQKPSDIELMSSVQDQKPNSTPVPQTLFKRVMKSTGESAIICMNLQEKQMNWVELRKVTDDNITDVSQFNVRGPSTQEKEPNLYQHQSTQSKTSQSNQTFSQQPVTVASSHVVSDMCAMNAITDTCRPSSTKSTLSVMPHVDKFNQTGSSSKVLQQASIPLNVFPNLGNQIKNQSAQKLNVIVVQHEDTETKLPNYWGGPNRVINVTSANTSTSIPFSIVSQMGEDLTNQYLISPSSMVPLSTRPKVNQDFTNPSIQVSAGNKSSLLSESQCMLSTSSGTQVTTASKGAQIIVNPSSAHVNPSSTLMNPSSTLVNQSSTLLNQFSTLVNQSSTCVNQSSTCVKQSSTCVNRSSDGQISQQGQILIKPVLAKQDFISTEVAKKSTFNHSLSAGMVSGADKIISHKSVSSTQSSTLASNSKSLENISVRTASESLFSNMYSKPQTDVEKSSKNDAKPGALFKSPVEIANQKVATSTTSMVIPCANFTSEAPYKAPSQTTKNNPLTAVSSSAQVSLKTNVIDLTEETAEFVEMNTSVMATDISGNKGCIENDSLDKRKAKMLPSSSFNCGTKSATEMFVDLTSEEENMPEVERRKIKFTDSSSKLQNKITDKGAIHIDSSTITRQSQEKSGMPKSYIEVDLTGPSSPDQSAVHIFKEIQTNNQCETDTSIDTQSEGISKPTIMVELIDGSKIFAKRVENVTKRLDESTNRLDSAGEKSLESDLAPSTPSPAQNLAQYYLPQPYVKKDMDVQNKADRSFNDCFLSFCSQQEPESSDPLISENDLPVQKHEVKMKDEIADSFSKEKSQRKLKASDRTAKSRKKLGKRSGEKKKCGPKSKRSNRKRLGKSNAYYKYSFCCDTSESEGNYSEYSDSDCLTEMFIDVDRNNDKDDTDSTNVFDSVKIFETRQGIDAGKNVCSLPVQFCRVVLTRIDDQETHNGLLDPDKLCSKKCREAHLKHCVDAP
ncbi:hypothetical protein ACJMK2_022670 [Sinanodonta woodiana]|uniref:Uncharacterized protein n=1 Tax=Sinanodonta woodiana TaxID=1069815 RepID=A0ABD3TJS2_SINWO